MTEPDVVVIGGGPAGLASAIVCATHGLTTVLVERHAFPIGKPCGEGLLPNGVSAFSRIGIDADSLAAHARPIAGIRYCTPCGRTAEASFDGRTCLGIRRTDLSRVLYTRARALPCLEVISGEKATVAIDRGRPQVRIRGSTCHPKLVIGADGLQSPTRAAAGMVFAHRSRTRWGCRQHFDGEPWTDHVEVHFGRGFDVYVTPLRGGVNVAGLWDVRMVRIPASCSPVAWLVAKMPALARQLHGRAYVDRAQGRGPFDVRVRKPWCAGVLLVGDAAGYVDPLTGEGVGLALEQAALLSETIVPALRCTPTCEIIDPDALAQFALAARERARPNRQLTHLLLRVARHPALVEWIVATLGAHPALFAHLLDVNMGRRELWQLFPPLFRAEALIHVGRTAAVRASPQAIVDASLDRDWAHADLDFTGTSRQQPQQLEQET